MGLDQKIDVLLSLQADVAVVPECSEKSIGGFKRLGIICRGGFTDAVHPDRGPGMCGRG